MRGAITQGAKNCVKLLIDKGCNVNERDPSGRTPLHYAIYGGQTEVVERLLDMQAGNRYHCQ